MQSKFLLPFILISLFGILSARALTKDNVYKTLSVADGYQLSRFARGVRGARLMVMTGNGDLIVSQTREGRISLVKRDRNGDNRTDGIVELANGLNKPHGLALDDGWLYAALEDRVIRYRFDEGAGKLSRHAETLFKGMPQGGHFTRTIRKGPDGWFYVAVGSSCNVCTESHPWRAAILRFKPGGEPEVFATGLRNTVGYDWNASGEMYSVDNGRDWLGDEVPPGELNKIEQGNFYGWPYFYGRNIADPQWGRKFKKSKHGALTGTAHDFRAHVAALSIKFLKNQKQTSMNGAALVAQHGSWNRSTPIGYRVVLLKFDRTGGISQQNFLSGFLQGKAVSGRPVDTLEGPDGTIYISDDYSGSIWQMKAR